MHQSPDELTGVQVGIRACLPHLELARSKFTALPARGASGCSGVANADGTRCMGARESVGEGYKIQQKECSGQLPVAPVWGSLAAFTPSFAKDGDKSAALDEARPDGYKTSSTIYSRCIDIHDGDFARRNDFMGHDCAPDDDELNFAGQQLEEDHLCKAVEEPQLSTRTNSSVARTTSSLDSDTDFGMAHEPFANANTIEGLRRQIWKLTLGSQLREDFVSETKSGSLDAAGQEVLRLSAAIANIRMCTEQAKTQTEKATTECRQLEERLRGFVASRERREHEIADTWRAVCELATAAQHQQRLLVDELRESVCAKPNSCSAGEKLLVQHGAAALENLRREVDLKDSAIRVLSQRCEALEALLAAGPLGPEGTNWRPNENSSTAGLDGRRQASVSEELMASSYSTAAMLRSQLATVRARRRKDISQLRAEIRRLRSKRDGTGVAVDHDAAVSCSLAGNL